MSSYLLLRDNKENGPYSLEQLLQLGLKPYDLVWVRDRSAAWRYPSEIDELKAYAPVIEEQPYDRFYRKPGAVAGGDQEHLQAAASANAAQAANATQSALAKQQEMEIEQRIAAEVAKRMEIELQKKIAAEVAMTVELELQEKLNTEQSRKADQEKETSARSKRLEVEMQDKLAAELLVSNELEAKRKLVAAQDKMEEVPATNLTVNPAPRKAVYVTMPASRKVKAVIEEVKPVIEEAKPIIVNVNPVLEQVKPVSATIEKTKQPAIDFPEEYAAYAGFREPVVSITESEPVVKLPEPVDEIRDRYLRTLNDRKDKIASQDKLKSNIRKIAALVLLIAGGVLTGFMMKGGDAKEGSKKVAQVVDQPVQDQEKTDQPSQEQPEDAVVPTTIQPVKMVATSNEEATPVIEPNPASTKAVVHAATQQEKIIAVSIAEKNITKTPVVKREDRSTGDEGRSALPVRTTKDPAFDENRFAKNNSITDPTTGERSKKTRDTDDDTPTVNAVPVKTNSTPLGAIANEVSVSSNEYKRVAFGGIRNLELTVTNRSRKDLSNVVVELQYLKPSEEPLWTDRIQFKNIEAGGSSTLRIPDTNRGIKVKYKLVQVKAGQDGVAGN